MHRGLLTRPLPYLGVFLTADRAEHDDRLTAIRRPGDWEGRLRFFPRGLEPLHPIQPPRTGSGA